MADDTLGMPSPDAYELTELQVDDPHWMLELLANPAFLRVPSSCYQALLEGFMPHAVHPGDVVIKQGETGDYFYLIRRGRAKVTRLSPAGITITLAEIGPGQTFGEEALLSGASRNASVTFVEAGEVMRLSKADFDALLRKPLIHTILPAQLSALREQGAQWVDVRDAEAFRKGSLQGAVNVPLFLLRIRLDEIDRKRPCIVFCDDGRSSATAAFLLVQKGFDAHVLQDGLKSLKKSQTKPNT